MEDKMKKVYTRIREGCDAYIYTIDNLGYYCILRAKFKSDFLNDASASSLLQFLEKQRGTIKLQIPDEFLEHLKTESRFNTMVQNTR